MHQELLAQCSNLKRSVPIEDGDTASPALALKNV
jgi:hypothetical protein